MAVGERMRRLIARWAVLVWVAWMPDPAQDSDGKPIALLQAVYLR
jgi:hypothetical protein